MTTATLPEHRKAYGAIHFSVRAYGVQVVGLAYDDGLAGGDGNVTPKTDYVDSSGDNDRVTSYLYEWRECRVAANPVRSPVGAKHNSLGKRPRSPVTRSTKPCRGGTNRPGRANKAAFLLRPYRAFSHGRAANLRRCRRLQMLCPFRAGRVNSGTQNRPTISNRGVAWLSCRANERFPPRFVSPA